MSFKLVNDPIHGYIRLENGLLQLIDTPQFQRLRDLKQLGASYFVFPGGSHNRFEHSIGVCHLAGLWLEKLKKFDERHQYEITDRGVFLIQVAGLCHDLGHGPFSHVFDAEFMPRARPELNWRHEENSIKMLEYLIDENAVDISRDERHFIGSLIDPPNDLTNSWNNMEKRERLFKYQIVSNPINSIDVDKFDYITRDCHQLGIKTSYDFNRLWNYSRIVDGEICFHSKEAFNLYEMFHTRYSLFKQVYSHRVAKGIEFMITDMLLHANHKMGISAAVDSPEQFQWMTDGILREIEISKDSELETSRELLKKLRRREIYKFVDEILLPSNFSNFHVKETDIANCQQSSGVALESTVSSFSQASSLELRPEDLIVQDLKIHYAMKEKNPVDHVHFYKHTDEKFKIKKEQVSLLIPDQFQERYLRLFIRSSNPMRVMAAQVAWHNYLSRFNLVTKFEDGSSPAAKTSLTPQLKAGLMISGASPPPLEL